MHKKRTVLPLVLIYAVSIGAGMDDVGTGDYPEAGSHERILLAHVCKEDVFKDSGFGVLESFLKSIHTFHKFI